MHSLRWYLSHVLPSKLSRRGVLVDSRRTKGRATEIRKATESKVGPALNLIAHTDTRSSQQKINWQDAKATLLDLRMYGHYLAYTGIGCGVASLSLFAPTIIQGLGYRGLHAQLFTVPPYAVAYLCTMIAAYASDRYQVRGLIAGPSLACSTLCFIILGKFALTTHRSLVLTLSCSDPAWTELRRTLCVAHLRNKWCVRFTSIIERVGR